MSHLASLLRHRHVDGILQDAETIRTWPDPTERMDAAIRFIQQALYEQAIGRIAVEELNQITALLAFAIEPIQPPPFQDHLRPDPPS